LAKREIILFLKEPTGEAVENKELLWKTLGRSMEVYENKKDNLQGVGMLPKKTRLSERRDRKSQHFLGQLVPPLFLGTRIAHAQNERGLLG
jgi:hypothetical protein